MRGKKFAVLSSVAALFVSGGLPSGTSVTLTAAAAGGAVLSAGCSGSAERSDTRQDARTEARTSARADERVEERRD
jgi:hypothetical protein